MNIAISNFSDEPADYMDPADLGYPDLEATVPLSRSGDAN